MANKVQSLPCKKIVRGDNDRTVFDPAGLEELAASIKAHKLQSPIIVRPIEGGRFEIVAGERRFRAVSTILKWPTIEAIVRPLDNATASAVMLSENTGRKDLDPVDEAFAYRKRIELYGWAVEDVANSAGVPVDRVRARLKLCAIRPDILKLVRSGNFPVGHAQMLAELDNNRQMIAARPLIDGKRLNAREFRQVIDRLIAEQQQETLFALGEVPQAKPVEVVLPSVPTAKGLPEFTTAQSTGVALMRYIEALRAKGHKHEARVVGTVLMGLVESNCARLPLATK